MTDKMEFSDILEDVSIQHESLLNARGIEIEIDCDTALFWALDRNLIAGVLDNVINNCFRYTKEKITISSFTENGYLVIRIEDDGTGYPPFMLFNEKNNPEFKKGIDFQPAVQDWEFISRSWLQPCIRTTEKVALSLLTMAVH